MGNNNFVLRVEFDYDVAFKNLNQDEDVVEHLEALICYIENSLFENVTPYNSFNHDLQDGFDIISYPDSLENLQAIKKHLHDQDAAYYKRLKIENIYNL